MDEPVRFIFTGPYLWRSFPIFNNNAFSSDVHSIVNACASRYAHLLLYTSIMHRVLEEDISYFKNKIEGNRVELEKGARKRVDINFIVVYDGTNHLAVMHSSLYALKSFLDVYAILIGKLINPKANLSFSSANINGQKVSGGRMINALKNIGQQSLAELTLYHSLSWISEAVRYRDLLSHRSDLDNMRHMQLPLHREPPHINFNELVRPAMPNGQDLAVYCDKLVKNLTVYICESIVLLPNINLKMISTKRFMDSVE